jgi:hypothetical protein
MTTDAPTTVRRLPVKDVRRWAVTADAWMREARDELLTLGMKPGFIRDYPITAQQYRDLAERCPLPEEHDDEQI